jgi:hypothetical protein
VIETIPKIRDPMIQIRSARVLDPVSKWESTPIAIRGRDEMNMTRKETTGGNDPAELT